MKKIAIIMVALLTFLEAGCTTLHSSQQSADLVTAVNGNLKADIDVGEKISGASQVITLFGFINFGDDKFADGVSYGGNSNFALGGRSIDQAKSAASYKAVLSSEADVIVLPRYTIEVTDYLLFKSTKATVTGNKGVIKSYKTN
jgi:hypothetical protein